MNETVATKHRSSTRMLPVVVVLLVLLCPQSVALTEECGFRSGAPSSGLRDDEQGVQRVGSRHEGVVVNLDLPASGVSPSLNPLLVILSNLSQSLNGVFCAVFERFIVQSLCCCVVSLSPVGISGERGRATPQVSLARCPRVAIPLVRLAQGRLGVNGNPPPFALEIPCSKCSRPGTFTPSSDVSPALSPS